MTKTIHTAARLVAAIDWIAVGRRVDSAIRIAVTTAQLLLTLATIAWDIAYEHRREIRDAIVLAIAYMVVAAERTHRACRWTRRQIDRLGRVIAPVLQLEPLQAMAAARAALERLVRRLYPVAA